MRLNRVFFRITVGSIISVTTTTSGYCAEISVFQDAGFSCEYCVNDPHTSCLLSGEIKRGDLDKIFGFIGTRRSAYQNGDLTSKLKCENIYMNSPGGDYYEGLAIMQYIHDSMITTTVRDGDKCLSACAIIWLGGARPDGHNLDNPHTDRRLAPKATLGFHAPYPLDRGGSFPSAEVTKSFVKAFAVSQQMLTTFARYRIPLWFAANLMHPDKDNFYYIDNIEKANLINATIHSDAIYGRTISLTQMMRGCFNLSHWGKGRSSYLALDDTYSRNSDKAVTFEQYKNSILTGALPQLPHKFMNSIQNFIPNTPARRSAIQIESIDGASDGSYQGEQLMAFFEYLASRLGKGFSALSPGLLIYEGGPNDYISKWYLFPSPGVVGPDDENIRDRGELCLFLEFNTFAGSSLSGMFFGTEINDLNSPQNLPVALLGLSGDTKLSEISEALNTTPDYPQEATRQAASTSSGRRPRWCENASTATERKICSDPLLSDLDVTYGTRFQATKALDARRARLIAKETIAVRDRCSLDTDCIAAAYRSAIDALGTR